MTNFVNDSTSLSYPKTDQNPIGSADATKNVQASEWNTICQAVVDLRTGVTLGKLLGFSPQSARPTTPSSATQFLWVNSATNNLTYFNGTADVVLSTGTAGGTVTSISAGTGISLSTNPIIATGTISLATSGVTPGDYTGANITVDAYGRITVAASGAGDISSVVAGSGLTGGGTSGDVTLNVGAGTGITVNADDIAISNTAVTPGSYTLSSITVDQQGRITAASSGGASTLASVYLAGSSATDQTILLTAADGGPIILKDAGTPIGTLLDIQKNDATSFFSWNATTQTFGANCGVGTVAGTGAFAFGNATGAFTTSTGTNTLSGNVVISGSKTFGTGTGTVSINGATVFAADKGVTVSAGTSAFDFSGGTGIFKSSSGANTLSGDTTVTGTKTFTTGSGTVTINGATVFGANIGLTVVLGTSAFDFSGGSGVFKTSTGAVTIGTGAVSISGAVTFAANIGITVTSGTSAFDFSGGSGVFTTSSGTNTLSGATVFAANKGVTVTSGTSAFDFSGGSGIFKTSTGAVTIGPGAVTVSGLLTHAYAAASSGSPTLITVTGPAHTSLTASAEAIDVNVNLARTVQFATGALTTQRAMVVQAPTYGFVGASTLSDAATFAITGAPVAGTNATLTRSAALWVQAGQSRFDGAIRFNRTTVNDTAYTGLVTDHVVAYTALTATRIVTLPLAAGTAREIRIVDENGGATTAIKIQVQRSGSDTVNGVTSAVDAVTTAFGECLVRSDGTSKWSVTPVVGATILGTSTSTQLSYGNTTANTLTSSANLTWTNASTQLNIGALNTGMQITTTTIYATNGASGGTGLMDVRGFRSASEATNPDTILGSVQSRTDGPIVDIKSSSALVARFRSTGGLQMTCIANGTNLTASTEANDFSLGSHTLTWATGALTTQRFSFFNTPTIAFAGASTVSDCATVAIAAAPVAGTNATITRAMALWVQAGTARFDGTSSVLLTQTVATTGSPYAITVTGAAHTTLTASAEAIDLNFNLARTVQFATGAITTQRAALFQAPTYGFVGASTITNCATVAITGAPVAGTNATLTSTWALWVQAGTSRFDGTVHMNAPITMVAGNFINVSTNTATLPPTVTWTSVTYANSWVDNSSNEYGVQYYKDASGFVHIHGLCKNGSSATATIFTLPAGYRPAKNIYVSVVSNGLTVGAIVQSSGVVGLISGSTVYASLDGIDFYAEA